jgi:hypothetical protein
MKILRSAYLSLWLAAAVALAALVVWLASSTQFVFWLSEEGGPIQSLTNWLYVAAMAITLFLGASIIKRKTLMAILIVQGYMLAREMDLHQAFFSLSITKIKFWLSGAVPVMDKLTAAVILLPIVWAGLYMLILYLVPILTGIRQRLAYAVSVLMLIVVTGLSKIFDRSLYALNEMFGWQFSDRAHAFQFVEEEMLECLIPVLFLVAFFQFRRFIRPPGQTL